MINSIVQAIKFGDLYGFRKGELALNKKKVENAVLEIFDSFGIADKAPEVKVNGRFGHTLGGRPLYVTAL